MAWKRFHMIEQVHTQWFFVRGLAELQEMERRSVLRDNNNNDDDNQ